MAGSGRRTFAAGEVLTASNVMNYLQDQAVMVFAGTAARGSAIGTAVSDGMVSYLADTNDVQVYKTTGTAVAGWESNTAHQSPNYIINGGFDIWQRGNSFSTSGWKWTADRFAVYTASTTAAALSTSTPTGIGTYSMSLAASSNVAVTQSVELVGGTTGTFSDPNQTFTFSLYAKSTSSNQAMTIDVIPADGFGGGNQPTAFVAQSITLTSSWQRFIVTFKGGTINSTNACLRVNFYGAPSETIYTTGWQLEAGQTATPFHRNANSIAGEFAACQRYYQQSASVIYSTCTNAGFTNSYTNGIQYFVNFRAVPTLYIYPTQWNNVGNATWYPGGVMQAVTVESNSIDRAQFMTNASGSYSLALYQWKAEAEL